jgi:hypothetical protein
VLTSLDGGNFEKASGWRQIDRSEPSFEERIMFAAMCFAVALLPMPWTTTKEHVLAEASSFKRSGRVCRSNTSG